MYPWPKPLLQVVSSTNTKLQDSITAANAGNSPLSVGDLLVSISKMAAVQQGDMSQRILDLSTSIAQQYQADPSYDPSSTLGTFTTVSCRIDCLPTYYVVPCELLCKAMQLLAGLGVHSACSFMKSMCSARLSVPLACAVFAPLAGL